MIVVDASAWASALAGEDDLAVGCRALLQSDDEWLAPSHMATEMLRTLRRLEFAGLLTPEQAQTLVDEVVSTEVSYVGPGRALLTSQWTLRHDVSAYAAAYVTLCLRHGLPLVTLDRRLARAAGALGVEVLTVEHD